jgi:hypothetical protein
LEVEYDDQGRLFPLPDLGEEWLTPLQRQHRMRRRQARHQTRTNARKCLGAAPEGQVTGEADSLEGADIERDWDDIAAEVQEKAAADEMMHDFDHDKLSFQYHEQLVVQGEQEEEQQTMQHEPQERQPTRGRKVFRPKRFASRAGEVNRFGIDNRTLKAERMNMQFLIALKWSQTVEALKSTDLKAIQALMSQHTDADENTVE